MAGGIPARVCRRGDGHFPRPVFPRSGDQPDNRAEGRRLYQTEGNYSAHKAKREKDREVEEKHYKTAMREIKHVEESIARFRQFNREKSIRARREQGKDA